MTSHTHVGLRTKAALLSIFCLVCGLYGCKSEFISTNETADPDLVCYLSFNRSFNNEMSSPSTAAVWKSGYDLSVASDELWRLTSDRTGHSDQALYLDGETFLELQFGPSIDTVSSFQQLTIAGWIRLSAFPRLFEYSNIVEVVNSQDQNDHLFWFSLIKYPYKVGGLDNFTGLYARQIVRYYPEQIGKYTQELDVGPYPYSSVETYKHVCVRYDQNDYSLFVNGEKVLRGLKSIFFTAPYKVKNPKLWIGRNFKGSIDEIYIFKRALTDIEIKGLAGQ